MVITFTQGGQLRFVDPRTFGEMFVTELDGSRRRSTSSRTSASTRSRPRCAGTTSASWWPQRHAKLKPALMDQKFIAGIGNIYSDEILFTAGLRWDRMSDSLSPEEVRRLYRAMVETLQDAVKYRGSSLADEQYVDLFGTRASTSCTTRCTPARARPCRRCRQRDRPREVRAVAHVLLRRVPGLSRAIDAMPRARAIVRAIGRESSLA